MADFTFVVMGTGGVGKSSITIRFVTGQFVERYDPTVEDCYNRQLQRRQKTYLLDIMDTAGQENYRALRDAYMRKGQGFMLVFGLNNVSSFHALAGIVDDIRKNNEQTPDIPILIVGNKLDLEDSREVSDETIRRWVSQRVLTTDESKQSGERAHHIDPDPDPESDDADAGSLSCIGSRSIAWICVSAKNGTGVIEAFIRLVDMAAAFRDRHPPPGSRSQTRVITKRRCILY